MVKFVPKIRNTKELLRDIQNNTKNSKYIKNNRIQALLNYDDFEDPYILQESDIEPLGAIIITQNNGFGA